MDKHTGTSMMYGFGLGSTLGASVGALYGTYEAFKLRIPGVYKIRHIGQATLGTGLAFGVFMAAGAFVQSGRSH